MTVLMTPKHQGDRNKEGAVRRISYDFHNRSGDRQNWHFTGVLPGVISWMNGMKGVPGKSL